jgi:hypothetical protein
MKALLLGWFLLTPCAVDSVAPSDAPTALPTDVAAAFDSWDALLPLPAQPECSCIVWPSCTPGNCTGSAQCVVIGILPFGGCNFPWYDQGCGCV